MTIMSVEMREKTQRFCALLVLDVAFLSIVVIAVNWKTVVDFKPLLLIELAFAVLRLAHAVSYNAIFEWVREPFCTVKPDGCHAGANVEPKYARVPSDKKPKFACVLDVIGELFSCPICTGTWASLILTAGIVVLLAYFTLLVHVLAVSGAYELLHRVVENQEWAARQHRVTSGLISPDEE